MQAPTGLSLPDLFHQTPFCKAEDVQRIEDFGHLVWRRLYIRLQKGVSHCESVFGEASALDTR